MKKGSFKLGLIVIASILLSACGKEEASNLRSNGEVETVDVSLEADDLGFGLAIGSLSAQLKCGNKIVPANQGVVRVPISTPAQPITCELTASLGGTAALTTSQAGKTQYTISATQSVVFDATGNFIPQRNIPVNVRLKVSEIRSSQACFALSGTSGSCQISTGQVDGVLTTNTYNAPDVVYRVVTDANTGIKTAALYANSNTTQNCRFDNEVDVGSYFATTAAFPGALLTLDPAAYAPGQTITKTAIVRCDEDLDGVFDATHSYDLVAEFVN